MMTEPDQGTGTPADARGQPPTPPIAKREPHRFTVHGLEIEDPYAWLRDESWPDVHKEDVLAYLRAENAYTDAVMAPVAGLKERLFEELKGRIPEDDSSVPAPHGPYAYYTRWEAGKAYRIYCRQPRGGGAEEILLDVNGEAEGKAYYAVRGVSTSPDGRLLAFGEDAEGSERFTLRLRDVTTGTGIDAPIPGTSGDLEWGADSRCLLYTLLDDSQRPKSVWRHTIGTDPGTDVCLYQETADQFMVHLDRTLDHAFLIITTGDHTTAAVRVLAGAGTGAPGAPVLPPRAGVQYDLHHRAGRFYARINDTDRNFRVIMAEAAAVAAGSDNPALWREAWPARPGVYLSDCLAFDGFFALIEREAGLPHLRLCDPDFGHDRRIAMPAEAYALTLETNLTSDQDHVRVLYDSLTQPETVYDVAWPAATLTTRKVRRIPTGYDPGGYCSERRWAVSSDGTQVPLSIVYPADFPVDGTRPVYLYGYGAYGLGQEAAFGSSRLSLLSRGFAYAIAHVRGGDELGFDWYEAAKYDHKQRSFDDYIACAEHLIDQGYSRPGGLIASGGSAGGMLVGAVVNQRPDLFTAAVARVPFVDVLNTMLDESLPLTTAEFEEWGNPKQKRYFDAIRAYSPYDNVTAQAYPPMLVTAGLTDPRVTYWEPAKWVARLRASKTDHNLLLLRTIMEGGHGGPSGRYARLEEVALEYAFLLYVLGDREAMAG